MSEEDIIERLRVTPITELNLGSASLRRLIKRAGFEVLPELLDLPEKKVDDLFGWQEADAIIGLQNRYRADPVAFAASVLKKREVDTAAVERILATAKNSRRDSIQRTEAPTVSRSYFLGDGPVSLPPTPFTDALRGFEKRTKEVFEDLEDEFEDVMVYQAFEEFSTDLDELCDTFEQLFDFYSAQPRVALSLIDRHLRNAFIVYVADRARNVYNKGNLWGNFFDELNIHDSNVQSLFKQTFANHVERRGMPLYARDEETNYYFYTALLHGGLSADAWVNLWEKSILPLAKEVAAGNYGFGAEMDGHSILIDLKNPESRFAPSKAVLNILEKAPNSTIAPLFEASMRVASQVESSQKDSSGYAMLSNFGLPEAAMEALRKSRERTTVTTRLRSTNSPREKRQGEQRLVYLPMASLQLDLAEGIVSIRWPQQQFPLHFATDRIDYYVDGKKELISSFDVSVGKCILKASSIAVKPQARYDIELKLMLQDEKTGEYEEASSLHQSFARSKPGCFEFIKDAKGLYRLRGRNEKIAKKRRIAYIVKDGFKIESGQGMTAVSEYETSGDWDNTQIFIYDVEPGATGSIVNILTGEEIAVWQERYAAKIDRRRIIGETTDGIDLYGYAPCKLGTNGGLPSITIEAFDGLSALDDLDIFCTCDEQRVSIPRHVLWTDSYGKSNAARIALVPQESILFDRHIESCLIEARQKSAGGKVIFKYRFAVIPIQDFKPTTISLDFGIPVAEYSFQAVLAIDIVDTQKEAETVNIWSKYTARVLLKDEFLPLRIRSRESGKETHAKLALAAIDVKVPDKLARISKKRPVCLADALDLGPSAANFKIVAKGWRYNRAVIVMLGLEPIFFKELKQPGEHEFNLFKHASSFQQTDGSTPNNLPLTFSLIYGDDVTQDSSRPAWTEVEMLDCAQGIGILGWKLLVTSVAEHVLRFEGEPACDVYFEFKRKVGKKLVAESFVPAGSAELVLPSKVVRLLDAQKTIIVEMSPSDLFENPEREYAAKFILKR